MHWGRCARPQPLVVILAPDGLIMVWGTVRLPGVSPRAEDVAPLRGAKDRYSLLEGVTPDFDSFLHSTLPPADGLNVRLVFFKLPGGEQHGSLG